MRSAIYIGVDVHKKIYSLCAIHGNTGETLGETKVPVDIKLAEKIITAA